MFLSSLNKELCTKEENNKAGYTLIFGGQCKINQLALMKFLVDWNPNWKSGKHEK